VDDPNIHHAIEQCLAEIELDEERMLLLGPDRAGNLLEVVLLDVEDGPIVIHAMAMRSQFARWLPNDGMEVPNHDQEADC